MISSSIFGGTAYLGISKNEVFMDLVIEGMRQFGINYGISRNNNLSPAIYDSAEHEIARRFQADAAIVLSSGYLAAQLVVQQYCHSHRLIYAPDTHPALWIGNPDAPNCSYKEWTELALQKIDTDSAPVLLITNSLNNLKPEIYDFEWLRQISSRRNVCLLVDDSHGIGITGENGEGVYQKIPKLPNVEVVVAASMAKAPGIDAGILLGNEDIIRELRNSAIYGGSSPPAPGILYAWMNAEKIYSEELQRLRRNTNYFIEKLVGKKEISFVENFPVFLLEDPEAGDMLSGFGIQISSFPYPDRQSKPLNRLVITSLHQTQDLEYVANLL